MRTRAIAILVAVCHLTTVMPAVAQQPLEPDSVVLKDGQVIKGTLTEMIENDHVNVQLPNGQTATIRWEALERIQRAGATPITVNPGIPVIVHVDAEEVVLERQNPQGRWGGGGEWSPVCMSPCDRSVPSEGYYRVNGDMRPSAPFVLHANRPNQKLVLGVTKSSGVALGGGITLLVIGSIGGLIGLIATLVGFGNLGNGAGLLLGGLVTLALSTGLVVLGIVLVNNGTTTKVDQTTARLKWRVPEWRTVDLAPMALTLPPIRF